MKKWKSQYIGFHFTHIPEFKESKTIINLKAKAAKLISQRSWVAPPPGYVKVNVDGASSIDGSGISGVGVIIRNEIRGVVAALCKALPLHYSVDWMELFAMEQGVLLAQEMNLFNVIFESDAISIIQPVSQALNGGIMGHLIQGIQLARSSFSCCSFQHVKRDYNRAAHKLAQFAKCNNVSNLWKGVIPPILVHLIQSGLG
ncbi:uncharacterized protein LOC142616204 [Castanea sativa]|uniref:uncharacterized protein LOC142616204 n=1 Tax=Castanea sativa TaxID=21020 RepID=UPI003F64CA36